MQNFKNVWGLYLRSQNPQLIWKGGTEKGGNGGIAASNLQVEIVGTAHYSQAHVVSSSAEQSHDQYQTDMNAVT